MVFHRPFISSYDGPEFEQNKTRRVGVGLGLEGGGQRGWNWYDHKRSKAFVVARSRITKRTRRRRHIASRETYHLVFALVGPPRQELPLKIKK